MSNCRRSCSSCEVASRGMCRPSRAEKPKVGELQMDWLRSEDLKEVKVMTAPDLSITLKCCAHALRFLETMCVGSRIRGKLEHFFIITGLSKMWELHRFCKFEELRISRRKTVMNQSKIPFSGSSGSSSKFLLLRGNQVHQTCGWNEQNRNPLELIYQRPPRAITAHLDNKRGCFDPKTH